jgi:predicted DNA-binding protein
MGRKRLEPGSGTGKSARIYVPVTDTQRRALTELSTRTGRSTAALTREALDAWLAAQTPQEVAEAS